MLKLTMNRDDAWTLLTEYTKGESLLKHALGVEAAVRGYARLFGQDEEAWGITALLHDFDYERWPTLGDHPNKGAEILREKGYPEWMIRAILSHAMRSEEHTSELQSLRHLVCRLLLEKKKKKQNTLFNKNKTKNKNIKKK